MIKTEVWKQKNLKSVFWIMFLIIKVSVNFLSVLLKTVLLKSLILLLTWFRKSLWGFPGGSDVEESACNAGDLGLIPGLGRFLWRREWQSTPVFLPGEFHGQRSLAGYIQLMWSQRVRHSWATTTHTQKELIVGTEPSSLYLLTIYINFVFFFWVNIHMAWS